MCKNQFAGLHVIIWPTKLESPFYLCVYFYFIFLKECDPGKGQKETKSHAGSTLSVDTGLYLMTPGSRRELKSRVGRSVY